LPGDAFRRSSAQPSYRGSVAAGRDLRYVRFALLPTAAI